MSSPLPVRVGDTVGVAVTECGLCGMRVDGQDDMTVHARMHGDLDRGDVPAFVEVTRGSG